MRAFYALGILTRHGFAAWKSWTNISRNSVPLFRCWMLHAFVRTFGQFRDLVYVTRNDEGATMLCVLWSLIRVVAMTLALTHVRRTEEFRKWTNFYSFTQLIWISIEILSNRIELCFTEWRKERFRGILNESGIAINFILAVYVGKKNVNEACMQNGYG